MNNRYADDAYPFDSNPLLFPHESIPTTDSHSEPPLYRVPDSGINSLFVFCINQMSLEFVYFVTI